MKFEFYVLNYNFNKKCVENFNIFDNVSLNNSVEKEVRKYLRLSKKYCHVGRYNLIYGFDGLCATMQSLIMWQEWARREYEISVGDAFEKDIDNLEKWDCYKQCIPNIPMITREVIWQYKQQYKREKNDVKR